MLLNFNAKRVINVRAIERMSLTPSFHHYPLARIRNNIQHNDSDWVGGES